MAKLGLALSGGGAKGAAHIGVLQAFEEEGISIDYISGTSSGSIVSCLYACGYTPYEILSMFKVYCKFMADYDKSIPFKLGSMLFSGKINIKGFAKGDNLEATVYKYCKLKKITNISDVKMPLAIPAVDIATGETIYYLSERLNNTINNENEMENSIINYSGNIASIVRASSSFPGVFEPKFLNNRYLVDGGVRVNTPVSILKNMGADKVISVCFDTKSNNVSINIVSIALKSFEIMGKELSRFERNLSDIVITPKLSKISLLECDKSTMIANAGYLAAKAAVQDIKNLI